MSRRSARIFPTLLLAMLWALALAAPVAAGDRDGDGLRDGFEARWAVSDPDNPDSDGDGVVDAAEDIDGDGLGNLGEQRFGRHPGRRDSDGDGLIDGREDSDGDDRSDAHEQDQRPLPRDLRPTLEAANEDVWGRQRSCGADWGVKDVKLCDFGDPGAAVTLAVVGDSKAAMLMPAFIASAVQEGWHLVTLLKGSCSPVLGTTNAQAHAFDAGRSCQSWRRNAIRWLNAEPPSLIVYVHSDDYKLVDASGRTLSSARRTQAWREGVEETVAALPATRILWLGDAPKNAGNPVRCLMSHRRDMSACVTRRRPGPQRTAETAIRESARAAGGHFGTLHDQICTYDPCPLIQGDTLMWRDEGHLTVTFTRQLAPSMRALLAGVLASSP